MLSQKEEDIPKEKVEIINRSMMQKLRPYQEKSTPAPRGSNKDSKKEKSVKKVEEELVEPKES